MIAAAIIAVVSLWTPANAAAVDLGVTVSQGDSSWRLERTAGCYTSLREGDQFVSDECASAPLVPGPEIALVRPADVLLTFADPVSSVQVRVTAPGAMPALKPAVRIDATHWRFSLDREPAGSALDIAANNWDLAAQAGRWDGSYRARISGRPEPLAVTVGNLRLRGRDVSLRLTANDKAAVRAYVSLRGRRVSNITIGRLSASTSRKVSIRLNRKLWRAARRSGTLVIQARGADGSRSVVRRALLVG